MPVLRSPAAPARAEAPAAGRARALAAPLGVLGRWGARGGGGRAAPAEAPRRTTRPALAATIAARPYATIAIVAASCVIWVLLRAGFVTSTKLLIVGPLHGDWWKLFSSQFAYLNGWYAFVTLVVVAIFGWLLERRFGALVVLVLFLGAGVAGALVALAVYPLPVALGANAGALALIAAWAAPDVRAARAGHYYEGDLLGAGALAALMLAMPFVLPKEPWLISGATVRLLALPEAAGSPASPAACSGCSSASGCRASGSPSSEPHERARRARRAGVDRSPYHGQFMAMTNAVVLIEAERDALSTLGGDLAGIEGVAEAYSVTGEWDFVAIVRVPDHEQLADVVTTEIGGLPGVLRTQTMVAFAAFSRHDLEALFSIGE